MAKLFLGVLSGTSLDAINIGAFSFCNKQAKLQEAISYPISPAIKAKCLQFTETQLGTIEQLGVLDRQLGELFAEAILAFLLAAKLPATKIKAIGYHGQTIQHRPNLPVPFTLQLGDPNIIVSKTGITTVTDFRRKDLAVGGQGAPLAPGFHAAVFASTKITRVIVNIGGISNISVLAHEPLQKIIGFDTGPGNCLIDAWVQQYFQLAYDQNGDLARSGKVILKLLTKMLEDPYFQLASPKSTGREYFNLTWVAQYLSAIDINYSPIDVLATLLQLTSITISKAILAIAPHSEVYICGGGAYNQTLMTALQHDLARDIYVTTKLGIAPEWVETGLFAWLARQRLLRQAGNIPSVTGAKQAVTLGCIY